MLHTFYIDICGLVLFRIGVVLSTRLKTTGIVTNTPGHTIQTYQTIVLTYQTIIRHPKTNLTPALQLHIHAK